MVYADIAGLYDSSGTFVELTNLFVLKHLLQNAKSVRFLLVLTINQITETRGATARQFIQMVQKMCSSKVSALCDTLNAMQIIVTRCKPGQHDHQDIDVII